MNTHTQKKEVIQHNSLHSYLPIYTPSISSLGPPSIIINFCILSCRAIGKLTGLQRPEMACKY